MSSCPCGSEADFSACCGPALDGSVPAKSAEALMRSRYTAHARGALDYLEETHVPLDGVAAPSLRDSAGDVTWTRLEIVEANAGGVADDTGVVEFRAYYRTLGGEPGIHHERSRFRRIEGRWVYAGGDLIAAEQARATPKPGRNAPCPCGSGKKYKRCCAG